MRSPWPSPNRPCRTNLAAAGNWTVGSGAGLINAIPLATTLNNDATPTVVTFLFTATGPAQVIVHGTTSVNFTGAAGAVADFAGNALGPASLTIS